jgi:hypothetical protein
MAVRAAECPLARTLPTGVAPPDNSSRPRRDLSVYGFYFAAISGKNDPI